MAASGSVALTSVTVLRYRTSAINNEVATAVTPTPLIYPVRLLYTQ